MKYVSKSYKPFNPKDFGNPIAEVLATEFIQRAQDDSMPPPQKINPFRGVTIIIGGTHSGKSAFASTLAGLLEHNESLLVANYALIEPTVDKYSYQLSHPAMLTMQQFIQEFRDALADNVNTFIVDSFRVLQYDLGGQAVSGGMSTGVFSLLTQLSELCYQMNIALIIPLNPNVKDDLYDFTVKNLKGSTHNIIDVESGEYSFRDLDRGHEKFKDVSNLHEQILGLESKETYSMNELAVTHFKANAQPNVDSTSSFIDAVPAVEVKTNFDARDDKTTVTRIKHLNNI